MHNNTPVSVIRKQGKISPDPEYSTESPPDQPNFKQIDTGSVIFYLKIDLESVSSEKKNTPDGGERFILDSTGGIFFTGSTILAPDIFPDRFERMTDTGVYNTRTHTHNT